MLYSLIAHQIIIALKLYYVIFEDGNFNTCREGMTKMCNLSSWK